MASNRGPMRLNRLLGVLVVSALALTWAQPGAMARGPAGKGEPRVVVAVIDSGLNPYHEYFNAGGPLYKRSRPSSVTPAVLEEFGIDRDHIIRTTRTGDFQSDFAKDKAQFDAIEAGEPYWFEGTNLIGISFQSKGQRLRPDGCCLGPSYIILQDRHHWSTWHSLIESQNLHHTSRRR